MLHSLHFRRGKHRQQKQQQQQQTQFLLKQKTAEREIAACHQTLGVWFSSMAAKTALSAHSSTEKKKKENRQYHLQASRKTSLASPLAPSSTKPSAASDTPLGSISLPERVWCSELLYIQRETRFFLKTFCWCHIIYWKSFQPEGSWLICLGSCGGKRKSLKKEALTSGEWQVQPARWMRFKSLLCDDYT